MKLYLDKGIEARRVRVGQRATTKYDGMNGLFMLPRRDGRTLQVIASDGLGWNHVSVVALVGTQARIPTYEEMDDVKRAFWDDSECVMQLHVPRTAHVSFHNECLHLWRPQYTEIPVPHPLMVGPINGAPMPATNEEFLSRIVSDMPHLAPYIDDVREVAL